MKVKELIEKLQSFDREKRVVIRGYEEGYNDILKAHEVAARIDVNIQDYNGQHGGMGFYENFSPNDKVEVCIELWGKNRLAEES